MNQAEKLLIAASEMAGQFTREDLAVKAWERYPDDFGLVGHEHPNCHKTFAWLSHRMGPVQRGWMRLHPRLHLTDLGKEVVAKLHLGEPKAGADVCTAEEIWKNGTAYKRLRVEHAMDFFGVTFTDVKTGQAFATIQAKLTDLRKDETEDGRFRYNLADFMIEKFGKLLGVK